MRGVRTTFALLTGLFMVSVLLISSISVSAHSADDPAIYPLYADQDLRVGDVVVWNDEDCLWVEYLITEEDWYLVEYHLAVGVSPEDLPQNRAGNPIPGHFEYKDKYATDDLKTSVAICINLEDHGFESGEEVVIAAHAVVKKVVQNQCMSIVSMAWDDDDEVGAQWSSDGIGWEPAVACWVHPSWADIADATWIWITEETDPAWEYVNVPDDGWYFQQKFDIPMSAFNIEVDEVLANADNAYRIAINGVPLDPEGHGAMDRDGPGQQEWATALSHDVPEGTVVPGENSIDIRAINFLATGDSTSNPAGLIYKVDICYDEVVRTETAWGADEDEPVSFPGNNWATYFCYTIQWNQWNIEGDWVLRYAVSSTYDHDMTVQVFDNEDGTFSGIGGYPAGEDPHSITWMVTGTVEGNEVNFLIEYDGSAYWSESTGTIAADGTMSGTWVDSLGQSGTWQSISGNAEWV